MSFRLLPLTILAALFTACPEEGPQNIALPDGLALDDLPGDVQALLRATITIGGGALNETDVGLDAEAGTISGSFTVQNVTREVTRTITLRVYGRVLEAAEEVLLGVVSAPITLAPGEPTWVTFGDRTFDTCGGTDDACLLLFDRNRNGRKNIDDLHDAIDPAPQPLALELSPATLQFPSGVRLGDVARQVVILENRGAHPVQVESVSVVDAPGVRLSVLTFSGGEQVDARRRLDQERLGPPIAVDGEMLLAVDFAPVNAFLATGAIQAVVVDTVTGVRQGVRTKIIANSDGLLPPVDAAYVPPAPVTLTADGVGVAALPVPATALFSGIAITSDAPDGERAGLVHQGAPLALSPSDGITTAFLADAAFLVDVPPGFRFSASLGGLDTDVDLAVVTVTDGVLGALACTLPAACLSNNASDSDEAVELDNDGTTPLSLAIVLSRIDVVRPDLDIPGALAVDDPVPFELGARVHRGPDFADDDPVSPLRGPVEGGTVITLRGRGFQNNALVTFSGLPAQVLGIDAADPANTVITVRSPQGTALAAGENPATIVVQNPPPPEGDGQAATAGIPFTYDPPAPNLEEVTPSFALASGGTQPVTIRGLSFLTRFGPPVAVFGALGVPTTFDESDLDAIIVLPPPAQNPLVASTVSLRVHNRVAPDIDSDGDGFAETPVLGLASDALVFSYVLPEGDPPTLDAVAPITPATGSVDGGLAVTLHGAAFQAGALAYFGDRAVATSVNPAGDAAVAVLPAGVEGPVDVAILNPDGRSATRAGAFSYVIPNPSIASVFPTQFPAVGGTLLVVSGSELRDGALVVFADGATEIPATNATRASSTSLLVVTPPLTAGAWDLTVINPNGARAALAVTVFVPTGPPPQVEALLPDSGPTGGGTVVQVIGRDFANPTVLFGGVQVAATPIDPAALPVGLDGVQVTAPPAAAGPALVQVINADFQTDTAQFSYLAPQAPEPRISSVQPGILLRGQPAVLSVSGSNFDIGLITLGGVAQPFSNATATGVSVSTNGALPDGVALLEVQNKDGASASASVLVVSAPPVEPLDIHFIDPPFVDAAVLLASPIEVRVHGAGFTPQVTGTVSGLPTLATFVSDRLVTVRVQAPAQPPQGDPPLLDIVLTDAQGGSDSAPLIVFGIDPPAGEGEGEGEGEPPPRVDVQTIVPAVLDTQQTASTLILFGSAFTPQSQVFIDTPGVPGSTSQPLTVLNVFPDRIETVSFNPSNYGGHGSTLFVRVSDQQNGVDFGAVQLVALGAGGGATHAIGFFSPPVVNAGQGVLEIGVVGSGFDPVTLGIEVNGQFIVPNTVTPTAVLFDFDTDLTTPGVQAVVLHQNGNRVSGFFALVPAPAPFVSAVLPSVLAPNTPVTLQVFGGGFRQNAPASQVLVNGQFVAPDIVDAFTIELPGFQRPAGAYTLEIRNPDGQSAITSLFVDAEAQRPRIDFVFPTTLFLGNPPQTVALTGQRFNGCSVYVDDVFMPPNAAPPRTDTDLEIDIDADLFGLGAHILEVRHDTNPALNDFVVIQVDALAPPRIDRIEPPFVVSGVTFPIDIFGAGFDSLSLVRVDGVQQGAPTAGPGLLEVDINTGGAPGMVTVEVENADGQRAQFVVERRGFSTVTTLSTNKLRMIGGDILRVNGTNLDSFAADLGVRISGPPSDQLLAPVPGSVTRDSFDVQVAAGLDAGPHNVFVDMGGGFGEIFIATVQAVPPIIDGVGQLENGASLELTLFGEGLAGEELPVGVLVGQDPGTPCIIFEIAFDHVRCFMSLGDVPWGHFEELEIDYDPLAFPVGGVEIPPRQFTTVQDGFGNSVFPALVNMADQGVTRRTARAFVTGFSANNLSSSAVLEIAPGVVGTHTGTFGNEVDFDIQAGALPQGTHPARIVDFGVVVAEGNGVLTALPPQIANATVQLTWSKTPNDGQVVLSGADQAQVVAVQEQMLLQKNVTSGTQSFLGVVEFDSLPLGVGLWRMCLQSTSGALFGCAPATTLIGAPNSELEGNNTDASATAIGIAVDATTSLPGLLTGSGVGTDNRDRFFVVAEQDSLLRFNVMPTGGVSCTGPDAGISVRVRKRGSAVIVHDSNVGIAGSNCGAAGVDGRPPIALDAGEHIIELVHGANPHGYAVVASVNEPREPTCGDGQVQNGEDAACEQGGALVCPTNGTAFCHPDNCLVMLGGCDPPTGPGTCGNGDVDQAGEQCDGSDFDPSAGTQPPPACPGNGRGVIRCDPVNCMLDRQLCMTGGLCGNRVTEGAEQCDDGNVDNTDGCTDDCLLVQCGDAFQQGHEACDDGNLRNGDGCNSTCSGP